MERDQKEQIVFFHLNLSIKTFNFLRLSIINPSPLPDTRKHYFTPAPQAAGRLHSLKKIMGMIVAILKSFNEPEVRVYDL